MSTLTLFAKKFPPRTALKGLVGTLHLLALTCVLCAVTSKASGVDVHVDCRDIQHCHGQFSNRGRLLCLAKELVNRLESAASECAT